MQVEFWERRLEEEREEREREEETGRVSNKYRLVSEIGSMGQARPLDQVLTISLARERLLKYFGYIVRIPPSRSCHPKNAKFIREFL